MDYLSSNFSDLRARSKELDASYYEVYDRSLLKDTKKQFQKPVKLLTINVDRGHKQKMGKMGKDNGLTKGVGGLLPQRRSSSQQIFAVARKTLDLRAAR